MTLNPVSTGDPHVSAHNEERDAINAHENALADKIDKPANPKVGELLRFNGTNWVSAKTRLFEGSGAPEGVVAAPVGSRYVDTRDGNGAVEWLKASGSDTNNTGWILLFGDTKFRNVSAMVDRRSTAVVHTALLRRYGDVVDLYLDVTAPTNTTSPWQILTLPAGFRPPTTRFGALQLSSMTGFDSEQTMVSDTGGVFLYNFTGGKRNRYAGVWTTVNPWPASLPGSAA